MFNMAALVASTLQACFNLYAYAREMLGLYARGGFALGFGSYNLVVQNNFYLNGPYYGTQYWT